MFGPKNLFFLLAIARIRNAKCQMEGRVVGGMKARIDHFPHSAFLNAHCDDGWICGSSILNQRILLTAAHCVNNCEVDENKKHVIEAYVGHADLTKVRITRKVKDILMHENYIESSVQNDVAVVMLNANIPFGRHVKRVALSKVWTFPEREGFVAGWGVVNETVPESFTVNLLSVAQKIRSPQTCSVIGYIAPGMFCGGSLRGNDPHPASGDSGSAFVLKNFHQVGVLSFKISSYPALIIYSNVTYYYKWIKLHSKLLYCRNMR